MSIKGSSLQWLERAIERGDYLTAWAVAFELRSVPVDHALALVVLAAGDPLAQARFDRAARRWTGLYLASANDPSLAELRGLVDALDELPDAAAVVSLDALCAARGWTLTSRALVHLSPPARHPR